MTKEIAGNLNSNIHKQDIINIEHALLGGGDTRLIIGPRGVNKYLCPAGPAPTMTCLSSCTASPISEAGFLVASDALRHVFGTRSGSIDRRLDELHAGIEIGIRTYLGLERSAEVLLTASGTDGMLVAAALLASEGGSMPMTAILPAASETGSGLPMATECRTFDGPGAGRSLTELEVGRVHVALRGPDGMPREPGIVADEFREAALSSRGRPIIYLTSGTKTGLVAPFDVPANVDVIVDACQLRLSPSVVRGYLARGWPVVITGSKFLGGPPFSGAVLLPSGRFSAAARRQALKVCELLDRPQTSEAEEVRKIGPLLRWKAALAVLDDTGFSADDVDNVVQRLDQNATAFFAGLPGARIIDKPDDCHGIVTFAVAKPGHSGIWLSADELRPLHLGLAEQKVLVGQPVDLGPFGGLRAAIGMRDVVLGSIEASLRSVGEAWPVAYRT